MPLCEVIALRQRKRAVRAGERRVAVAADGDPGRAGGGAAGATVAPTMNTFSGPSKADSGPSSVDCSVVK